MAEELATSGDLDDLLLSPSERVKSKLSRRARSGAAQPPQQQPQQQPKQEQLTSKDQKAAIIRESGEPLSGAMTSTQKDSEHEDEEVIPQKKERTGLSREERVFQRQLQEALEASKSVATPPLENSMPRSKRKRKETGNKAYIDVSSDEEADWQDEVPCGSKRKKPAQAPSKSDSTDKTKKKANGSNRDSDFSVKDEEGESDRGSDDDWKEALPAKKSKLRSTKPTKGAKTKKTEPSIVKATKPNEPRENIPPKPTSGRKPTAALVAPKIATPSPTIAPSVTKGSTPKWMAPRFTKSSGGCDGSSSSPNSISVPRLGLSRNYKALKPLHGNVKLA